ncbi:MAG: extracellular solute-binding protein [Eubacteriales bacterium]|nr:extracellular solute-binding protein [Eubacteriales bacterium]
MMLFAACADDAAGKQDAGQTAAGGDITSAADERPLYSYPDENYGGEEFNILNIEPIWGFYTYLDFENMTGDVLDDTVYARNRFIEEQFNIELVVAIDTMDTIATTIRTVIMAGEDAHDAMYCRGDQIGPLITEKYFYNLFEIPELNLSETWWDQTVIKEGSIGKDEALYFAASDMSLIGFQGTWIIYFNENMLADIGLQTPYESVRSGSWTLDEFGKYIKAGANLNGDNSFAWNASGNAVYGYSSYNAGTAALLIGTGERFILKDDNGYPYFAMETPRFYEISEQIAAMLAVEGEYHDANDSDGIHHYEQLLMSDRALMIAAEIKAADVFREMDDTFGVVPIPKFEEAQQQYYCLQFQQTLLITIPITNLNTRQAGIILDAFSYQSYEDLMPVFYDVTVSQKGLRNDESIEMLGIIRDTRFFNVGMAYGWISTLYEQVRTDLTAGKSDMASLIAREKDKITASIDKFMTTLEAY